MALTGFVATMPYIALQLVGIQAVLEVAGFGGNDNWLVKDLPLLVAFAVLAAYTYSSGLRAPALIAFVKDFLIYLVVIVAVIYLPSQVGGWDAIFGAAEDEDGDHQPGHGRHGVVHPGRRDVLGLRDPRPRLGDGAVHVSPLGDREPVVGQPQHRRRNAAILPAYSFVLGLLALLGGSRSPPARTRSAPTASPTRSW